MRPSRDAENMNRPEFVLPEYTVLASIGFLRRRTCRPARPNTRHQRSTGGRYAACTYGGDIRRHTDPSASAFTTVSDDRACGGLTARLYSDFFTLSAYRPDYSLGSFDFLFNWRLPPLGMPDLDFDIVLTQISQLSYIIGIGSLVLERVFDIICTLVEKL